MMTTEMVSAALGRQEILVRREQLVVRLYAELMLLRDKIELAHHTTQTGEWRDVRDSAFEEAEMRLLDAIDDCLYGIDRYGDNRPQD